jgi:UDP-GlcNAc:undecaprenyl-phosphate GlcNAc-1-phosphate transferase
VWAHPTAQFHPCPFFGTVRPGALSLVFTLLWIVGVVNAMKLIDGLDGLAVGVGQFGVATTFVMAASRGDPIMMLFMAYLGGSLLGFLVYNFNPAAILLGGTSFIHPPARPADRGEQRGR